MEQRVDTSDQSVLKGKLFVGQVPKEMMEDNLRPYFDQFGTIREITIIRDPLSGLSRGCAFVIYHERTSAQNAMDSLHNILHLPNATNPLQVRFAETPLDRETKLFIGMLPKSFSKNDVATLFGVYGEIKEIHIIRGPEGNPQGCAFVKFVEKEAAAGAIENLNDTIPSGATRPMVVRYAESKGSTTKSTGSGSTPDITKSSPIFAGQQQQPSSQHLRPPAYLQQQQQQPLQHPSQSQFRPPNLGMQSHPNNYGAMAGNNSGMMRTANNNGNNNSNVSQQQSAQMMQDQAQQLAAHLRPPEGPTGANLFVYHLPRDISDADLATLFAPFGNVISAKVFVDPKTSDSKGFGFVSYDRHDSADNAIASMNGFQIGSKRLKVEHKRISSALWSSNAPAGASHATAGFGGNNHNSNSGNNSHANHGYPGNDDLTHMQQQQQQQRSAQPAGVSMAQQQQPQHVQHHQHQLHQQQATSAMMTRMVPGGGSASNGHPPHQNGHHMMHNDNNNNHIMASLMQQQQQQAPYSHHPLTNYAGQHTSALSAPPQLHHQPHQQQPQHLPPHFVVPSSNGSNGANNNVGNMGSLYQQQQQQHPGLIMQQQLQPQHQRPPSDRF